MWITVVFLICVIPLLVAMLFYGVNAEDNIYVILTMLVLLLLLPMAFSRLLWEEELTPLGTALMSAIILTWLTIIIVMQARDLYPSFLEPDDEKYFTAFAFFFGFIFSLVIDLVIYKLIWRIKNHASELEKEIKELQPLLPKNNPDESERYINWLAENVPVVVKFHDQVKSLHRPPTVKEYYQLQEKIGGGNTSELRENQEWFAFFDVPERARKGDT
jgi:hypothetical protein